MSREKILVACSVGSARLDEESASREMRNVDAMVHGVGNLIITGIK